jgi:hypothetical protein
MTGVKINLGKSVVIKDGKLVRVHKVVAGQPRKVKEAKASKQAAKWVAKSKQRETKA